MWETFSLPPPISYQKYSLMKEEMLKILGIIFIVIGLIKLIAVLIMKGVLWLDDKRSK